MNKLYLHHSADKLINHSELLFFNISRTLPDECLSVFFSCTLPSSCLVIWQLGPVWWWNSMSWHSVSDSSRSDLSGVLGGVSKHKVSSAECLVLLLWFSSLACRSRAFIFWVSRSSHVPSSLDTEEQVEESQCFSTISDVCPCSRWAFGRTSILVRLASRGRADSHYTAHKSKFLFFKFYWY